MAVSAICDYMKSIGNFTYSESTYIYPCFENRFFWDGDVASFVAGNICTFLPSIKHVALGKTASDTGGDLDNRIARAHRIFGAFETKATKMYPVEKFTKQEIYDMLPEDLRKLVWSCRTPSYSHEGKPSKCGKCQTCLVFPKN